VTLAGPCDSWTPIYSCALPTGSEAVSGTALAAATEVLYALSGRRFGLCTVALRPCRRDCADGSWPTSGMWWEWGRYPQPALVSGQWFNITCGGCAGACSCSTISEVVLPTPVYDVTQVKVDGVVLAQGVDYRVDDYRLLVRLGGEEWPTCNDLALADTEDGTWSVTVQVGDPVPPLGQVAVGELTVELAKALLCDDTCALPKPVQSIARQGVNITFLDPNEVFTHGRTGMYVPDLFIQTYNPGGLRQPSKVYDIDGGSPHRMTSTST